MKKLFLLAVFSVLLIFSVSGGSSSYYVTSCGVVVLTLDRSNFKTFGEWESYCKLLDEVHCGKKAEGTDYIIHEKIGEKDYGGIKTDAVAIYHIKLQEPGGN